MATSGAERARQRILFQVAHLDPRQFALLLDDEPMLRFTDEGRSASLCPAAREWVAPADMIRWGAPLGLAAQGVTCLHAAAVLLGERVIAIAGVGGAGKSTLARLLTDAGATGVADDVVVCDDNARVDLAAEPALRAWSREMSSRADDIPYVDLADLLQAAERRDWRPLDLVVVLGERLHTDDSALDMNDGVSDSETALEQPSFELQDLPPLTALTEIAQHRFGSHPSPAAWERQLKVFAGIADRVPVIRLRSPDGLDALEAALPALMEGLIRRSSSGRS